MQLSCRMARFCRKDFACELSVGDGEDGASYPGRYLLVRRVGWKVPFMGGLVSEATQGSERSRRRGREEGDADRCAHIRDENIDLPGIVTAHEVRYGLGSGGSFEKGSESGIHRYLYRRRRGNDRVGTTVSVESLDRRQQ